MRPAKDADKQIYKELTFYVQVVELKGLEPLAF